MADYYPLLARALDALPDRSPAMRKAVYERARGALIGQLRSLDPPLPDADIEVERKALDGAIERLEAAYAAPAPSAEPAPEPEPAAPPPQAAEPAVPEPLPPPPPANDPSEDLLEPEPPRREPGLPPATPADLAPPETQAPRRETPPLAIAPRKPREGARDGTRGPVFVEATATAPAAAAEVAPPVDAGALRPEGGNGRTRPRIAVVAPGGGRSKMLRNAFVGSVLAIVIGLIAVAAFMLRDKPSDLQPTGADVAEQPERPDAKFADRVGGEPAPAERPPSPAAPSPAPPQQNQNQAQPAPPPTPSLTIAQRAVLIEEDAANPNAQPPMSVGRVAWRLESVSGEQGQPLETAVVATVDIPDAGFQLVLTIQRNLDATLPASHTVKLVFSQSGAEAEKRKVQDVGLIQAKDEETARGAAVSGLPVRVRDNLFLIGLSSLRTDIDRNTDLLLHKNWFDLALKYASGQRAVITFEKGNAGTQALQRAFDQWK